MIPSFHGRAALLLSLSLATAWVASPAHAARRPGHLPDDGRGQTVGGRSLAARGASVRWGASADPRRATAWRRLEREIGPSWVLWEPTTAVPRQIVAAGVTAPGTPASARDAERFATAFVARHLELLAPGATMRDLQLVTRDLSGDVRTFGWVQRDLGRPVVGGQLSVRLSHDKLVAIASSAWPDLAVPAVATPITHADARAAALHWLARDVAGRATAHSVSEPMVLPIVGATGIEAHEVLQVGVTVEGPRSEWAVWLRSDTGAPVARRQLLAFAAGTLLYDVPQRGPLAARVPLPAVATDVLVDGLAQTTDALGNVSFAGPSASVLTGLWGPFVTMFDASGPLAADTLALPGGGSATWSAADDEIVDAQLSAFVHAALVKQYVRGIAPDLAWLDNQVEVTVNIDDQCNAFSDGDSINFFRASENCENTGRLADVVYHEFGHSVHHQSVLAGVGSFDVALSEGVSDYLSATITGDPALAPGFFLDDTPLRHLDPADYEYRWPDDNGEVHMAGLIIGGALWDLRKILIDKHGVTAGIALTDNLWYEATRRAVDIPSMYIEALVVDDDDGDLSNGTPNACEINAAFGPHGLFTPGEAGEQVVHTPTSSGEQIDLLLTLPTFPGCPVDATARVEWRLRDTPDDIATIEMAPANGGFTATIPQAPAGSVVQYRVVTSYSNGAVRSLPENLADPWYETFVGEVIPIWCASFDDDAAGWSLEGEWRVGTPPAQSSVDPVVPFGADPFVLGVALEGVGEYAPFTVSVARTPPISIPPGFSSVRLQYRRWLTVEDGFFDQAWVGVDGDDLWSNYASDDEDFASVHHRDREWRFHDIDITSAASDGTVGVELGLQSDAGLQLGGWTVDELCVVGFDARHATCGNGIVEAGEQCDDANLEPLDGCDACISSSDDSGGAGAGGGRDTGDDDSGGDDDSSTAELDQGGLIDRGCACRHDPRGGHVPVGMWLGALVLAASRHRHARARRDVPARHGPTSRRKRPDAVGFRAISCERRGPQKS